MPGGRGMGGQDDESMMPSNGEKNGVAERCRNMLSQNGILKKPLQNGGGCRGRFKVLRTKKSPGETGLDEEGVCCCAVEQAFCRIRRFPPAARSILSLRRFHVT